MKCYAFVVFTVLFTVVPIAVNCFNDVPAFLWNIKGNALHIKPVSAFEVTTKKYMDNFLKESLTDKSTAMLVFLTDELSLEDFASESPMSSGKDLHVLGEFLDTRPYMILPHVRDPLKRLRNVQCEKEELRLNENMPQALSSALDRSCVVVIHLPNSKSLDRTSKTQVDAVKNIVSSLSTAKKNVIGMFTASKSSWISSENQHKSRSLLAQKEQKNGELFNNENCTVMYATNVIIRNMSSGGVTAVIPLTGYNLDGSDCNDTMKSVKFVINFKETTEYPIFAISMVFQTKIGTWQMTESDVTIQSENDTSADSGVMEPAYVVEAPKGYSYSCGAFSFETNSTTKYTIT